MELVNTASQGAACEDAVVANVTGCAKTCGDEAITGTSITATEVVSSCGTTDDNSLAEEKCASSLDPYGYVQRGDYTSEVYKLELMNLPRRFGIAVSKFYLLFLHLCVQIDLSANCLDL